MHKILAHNVDCLSLNKLSCSLITSQVQELQDILLEIPLQGRCSIKLVVNRMNIILINFCLKCFSPIS